MKSELEKSAGANQLLRPQTKMGGVIFPNVDVIRSECKHQALWQ